MHVTRWQISKNEALAENGMVAAKHPLAAEAGLKVLQDGGNAVDAAITTALAMGVLEPYMNGIGGGGFMLFHDAGSGENHFLDYFMPAPQAATSDMYEIIDEGATDVLGFRGIKDDANYIGHRSVGVPGLVAGAARALETFGTISLTEALQPAIRFAEDGFDMSWHNMLMTGRSMDLLARFPATAEIFLRDGKYLLRAADMGPADRLVQRDLGTTLQRVAEDGTDGFYRGDVAQAIVQDLAAQGNPISEKDLDSYETLLIRPRTIPYRDGYELVIGPGTGGSTLAETFSILEGFDFHDLKPNGAQALHLFIEAARIAYADRWQHLADETYVDVPWKMLESKEYGTQRRADIQMARAAEQVEPWTGGPFGRGTSEIEGGCTTHLSVVDKDHSMVAITQTINMVWGSGVVVPPTGILFNDTMVLFDPRPGRANSIAGGKRPLSSMTPMLVLKDGRPFMTVGAPGGRMIMGTVMKVIHNVIDLGMGIQEACASVAVDASGDKVIANAGLGSSTLEALSDMGHPLDIREPAFLPRLFASPTGILVNQETGNLHGGADPYHPGIALGF
jgi:gamma-glutamyltranspeptidase/glutathione hydrolase